MAIILTTGNSVETVNDKGVLVPYKPENESQESVSDQGTDQDENLEQSESSSEDETQELQDDESSDDGEESEQKEDDEIKDDKPKKKGGFKKRIERFQKQLSAKDQEIEFLRQQISKGLPKDEPKQSIKTEAEGKPKPSDYETHEEYIDALTDWKIEVKEKEIQTKQRETQAKTEYQKQVDSFQTKVSDFSKTKEDFQEVIEDVDDISMSIAVQESILSSDIGPELMYELAKNRSEYERINSLSPLAAAREIGKIESKLIRESSSKKEIKTTKAPAPLKPIGKSASKITKSIFDPNLSQKEYEELRAKQMKNSW